MSGQREEGTPPECPKCGRKTCVAHVEDDRIAWWSCDTCEYQWPRGMWTYDDEDEAEHLRPEEMA